MKSKDARERWRAIEKAVKHYAEKRDVVAATVDELEAACRALVAKRSNALKLQVEAMASAKAALHDAIGAAPEWFEQPKTQTAHGVKFGYRKLADRYVFDEAKTLALIEREGGRLRSC
ncbi:MAG: hypothetical protein ABW161_01190 [Candidatus Thiodiazotropha sp.]